MIDHKPADAYVEQCRAQYCDPCCETLAALKERQAILEFIAINQDQTASELARRIAAGAHEP